MKRGYIYAIAFFAISICGIAFLSIPDQTTRVALYLDSHELKRAEDLLWEQYKQNPDDLDTASKLVETLQALKEFQQAKKIAQNALSSHPGNIYWKRKLAYILLEEKNPDAASAILAPNERDGAFWGALAQAWHNQARDELAEKALFEAHENDRDRTDVWRILAKWRAERHDFQGEKIALEEALKTAPKDKDLLSGYFRNRARAGDLKTILMIAARLPQPLEREFMESLYRLHIENNDYDGARKILEQLVAREDTIPADTLALVSVLYRQNDFPGARALLDKLAESSKTVSTSVRGAIISQSHAIRMALMLEHADRGNEQPLLDEIANMRSSPPDQEVVRNVIFACLRLSDFYDSAAKSGENKDTAPDSQKNKARQFWLDKAQAIYDGHKDALPFTGLENAYLAANLAERRGNWAEMRAAWEAIAKTEKPDFRISQAIARASFHLGDYEKGWQNLLMAENLSHNDAQLLSLALDAQLLASSLPAAYPGRGEKLRHADELARKYLARNWNTDLALNLFNRSLAASRLTEADEILEALEKRGLATPSEYLGLAEAELAARATTKAPSPARHRAAHNAEKALANAAPEELPRLLYIFMTLHDKQRILDINKRIKKANLPQSPALLRQMAEAWGMLGERKQQLALLEQSARLTGRLADWEELVDKCYWNGEPRRALELLDAADAIFPANAALAGRRMTMLADIGDFHKAIKFYKYVNERDNEIDKKIPAEGLAALALAYDREGHPDRAHHFYNLALAKEPENNRAVLGVADLHRRLGNKAKAARLMRGFVERNPSNLWARADLAELNPNQKKKQYADILASKQGGEAEEARAVALWKTGRIKRALRLYSELMEEGHPTQSMMRNYAQVLMDAGRFEDAEKVLRDAVGKFPRDFLSRRLLAAVYIHKKDYRAAEKCLRDALLLSPENKEILRDLAFVLQARQKFWSAQKIYMAGGKR